jgi:COP9 signalosome complex subunit 6
MANEGTMDIKVHPLVVMSIADHFTRDQIQVQRERVIGTLFGFQTGREVNILETFEIAWKEDASGIVEIDQKAFEDDMKLFKEAYEGYECLGWYSTGPAPRATDSQLHELMSKYNERPFYMLLDPEVSSDSRELPLQVFIEEVKVVEGATVNSFKQCSYEIFSDEAERITAVHCAKIGGGDESSALSGQFINLSKAIGTLNTRVAILQKFLSDTKSGLIKPDHKILRAVKALCQRLPTMDSPAFTEDFLQEYNDALLVAYLSSITKGATMCGEVVEKFTVAYGDSAQRGRGATPMMGMGGMF